MWHLYARTSQIVPFGGHYTMYSKVSWSNSARRVLLCVLIVTNFSDKLGVVFPENTSHLFIQCLAGTLSGFATTVITNPLDTVRARLQVCFHSKNNDISFQKLFISINSSTIIRYKEPIPFLMRPDLCGVRKACGCSAKAFQLV